MVKTPKIYFNEPGLLSWLLQIETSEHVSRDPLMGTIFENMVVMEAVKAAYNRGESSQLSLYGISRVWRLTSSGSINDGPMQSRLNLE